MEIEIPRSISDIRAKWNLVKAEETERYQEMKGHLISAVVSPLAAGAAIALFPSSFNAAVIGGVAATLIMTAFAVGDFLPPVHPAGERLQAASRVPAV